MGQIIVITSLKGGVGKTTLSAGLSFDMAQSGKRVLALDMDLGTGGLDIALGREDMVGATVIDVLTGKIPLEKALIQGEDGVYFMCAPIFFNESCLEDVTQQNFDALLSALKESFDAIIFDMPAGGGSAFRFFENCGLVDLTLIVTTSSPTAVRAAERCAIRIKGMEPIKLVLNGYHLSKPENNTFGVLEIINRASVPIVGVIPFDSGAEKALAKGIPLSGNPKSVAGRAMRNIAWRIGGEEVRLLSGVIKKKKRQRFY